MTPQIIDTPLQAALLGASLLHQSGRCYGDEIRMLLDRVWPVLRARLIPNPGINWVVYGGDGSLFAGVEATVPDPTLIGLDAQAIHIPRHAQWKHIGPYSKLGEVCAELNRTVKAMGLTPAWPLIEIYGHWTDDPSKLETTLVLSLQ